MTRLFIVSERRGGSSGKREVKERPYYDAVLGGVSDANNGIDRNALTRKVEKKCGCTSSGREKTMKSIQYFKSCMLNALSMLLEYEL